MTKSNRPQRLHLYLNHHIDSRRWDRVVPRDDDIVIATPYKCGTTWTQGIVSSLVLGRCAVSASPWADFRPVGDSVVERIEKQKHRRFLKTHLPLDGIPFHEQIRYIVVSRDPRDVFMSLWNHYSSYTDAGYAELEGRSEHIGDPFPRCPEDVREFWKMWISRGWFEWETEGYPFWSNLGHVQSWWNFRHLSNILFVHYNHLKQDVIRQIRRIAAYLEIAVDDAQVNEIVNATTLDSMRKLAKENEDSKQPPTFSGGADSFYYKGTNNRWQGVLTKQDLQLYDEAAERVLTTECRRWLEKGILEDSSRGVATEQPCPAVPAMFACPSQS
ncbi:MAG: sulfotransferase domain-containing protein [Candidatus Latescibacterota bacterium]|nr:sulfotransferase domain-containing protein [Candidatus Latescibacterota bacterium]